MFLTERELLPISVNLYRIKLRVYSGVKKVKQSHYRPGQAKRVLRNLRLQDFVTTQDGVKVVSLTHRPLFTTRKHSWYSFLLEAESTPGP